MDFNTVLNIHKITVTLFLLLLTIKGAILFIAKKDAFENFRQKTKVLEIIIDTVFLLSGIYLIILGSARITHPLFIVKLILVIIGLPVAIIAFKKANKLLVAVAIVIFVAAYGLSEMAGKAKPAAAEIPPAELSEVEDEGKKLYLQYCVSCHGIDGKLGLSGATDLTQSELDLEQIQAIIRDGRKNMPPYKDVLTDEEIKKVGEYVMSLHN